MFLNNKQKRRGLFLGSSQYPQIDLDSASTTPMSLEVLQKMKPYFLDIYFNPSALHLAGQSVASEVSLKRREIADFFNLKDGNVLFTASATEANNWVVQSCAQIALPKGIKPHIIYSAIEHDSVIAPIKTLENKGFITTTVLNVDKNGLIDIEELEKKLSTNTVLVSIMGVNNEIGVLEPLEEIGKCLTAFRQKQNTPYPYFHTDAVQALNYFSWSHIKGLDYLTLSAHKVYGPKGIGSLLTFNLASFKNLQPLILGGHQEFNLRAGTENVPLIVGLAQALSILRANRKKEIAHLADLRKVFLNSLLKENKLIKINGSLGLSVSAILNCYFPGVLASDMVIGLSEKGILASPGAACSASSNSPSHVISALYHNKNRAQESIRFSFNHNLSLNEVKKAAIIAGKLYNKLAVI
ncbi:MAG: cysteine desulfurase family protein [Candidatus Parcubacteria bacterium]|nr:cysteine desulfurase family protein [Candidatus Parcubacteria bacterium]